MVIVQQGPLLAMFPSVAHVVLVERNKNMEKKGGVERARGGEGEGVRTEKNNNRLWKRDKLRNKECIHGREGG